MFGRTLLLLLILLMPTSVFAEIVTPFSVPANQVCRRAIAAAERAHGIPTHLLAAIARVESGRRDQDSGSFNPWPWTINADGQGSFYDTKMQAVAAASSMLPRAGRSVDVGCMQISLTYHPNAFSDLNQAFDPVANADYGARFLAQLYEKTNSWPRAVEQYHSATADIGAEYGRRVYAVLPEESRLAQTIEPDTMASTGLTTAATASFGRVLFPPLRQGMPRMVFQASDLASGAPVGRSLDSYRAAPVRMMMRPG